MEVFFVYNNVCSHKTIAAYFFWKVLSNTYKVSYLNLDMSSFFLKNQKYKKYFNNTNFLKIEGHKQSIDFINKEIETLQNKGYQYCIIDSSSTNSAINNEIFKIANTIICPIDINSDNSKNMINLFLKLKSEFNIKAKIKFFISGYNKKDVYEINKYFNIKKNIIDIEPNMIISKHSFNEIDDLLLNKELEKEYVELIKSLKIF